MLRISDNFSDRSGAERDDATSSSAHATHGKPAYGPIFWFAYLANTSLMMAVSLLFRYGDFVAVLGGGELELGWIVGVGTVGSLLMRLVMGVGIDHYGARTVWLLSLVGVAAMLLAHLAIRRVDTPTIYLVRVIYHTCLAGAFGASITYISLRAPVARMAEMVGMLGSSGFVGMALGSQLGDLLCRADEIQRWHVNRLFLVAGGLAGLSFFFASLSTRGQLRPVKRRRPPIVGLLRRYHPGSLLVIAVAIGAGLGLPGTFLRPYAASLNISQIGLFFGVYAGTAFVMRLLTRRVPDRIGPHRAILLGMTAVVVSLLLYLPVRSLAWLALPAFAVGIGHALLFPAVMAGGGRAFPVRYRGLGTTLTMGMFDLGNLIGMPLAGTLIAAAKYAQLPPYPVMFLSLAALLTAMTAYFACVKPREAARQQKSSPEPLEPSVAVGSCS